MRNIKQWYWCTGWFLLRMKSLISFADPFNHFQGCRYLLMTYFTSSLLIEEYNGFTYRLFCKYFVFLALKLYIPEYGRIWFKWGICFFSIILTGSFITSISEQSSTYIFPLNNSYRYTLSLYSCIILVISQFLVVFIVKRLQK